jgi:hypothetical protein
MVEKVAGAEAKEAPKKTVTKAEKVAKSEAMVNKAANADKKTAQREAEAKKNDIDPLADVEHAPTEKALKSLKVGFVYNFKANHGRVKFEGSLYERGDSFETQMTKELLALCEQGILIPTENI